MYNAVKNALLWLVIAVILVTVFSNFGHHQKGTVVPYTYSEFNKAVASNQVRSVVIQEQTIRGETKSGQKFSTYMPLNDNNILPALAKHNVAVTGIPPKQQSLFLRFIIGWLPMILIFALMFFFYRQMQGGGKSGGPLSFGRSKARLLTQDQVKVTFADVAGAEEAKHDVEELVQFLKNPTRFQRLGGKMPCGVLLVGPPGTGKTLLARAVAGEAKVPFFTISGSDFVEMFVGVGASRVRDMFEQAKRQAPCIIFIDEIDAVGRHRGAGLGGGHDEREQTLNQLLVEMDGFEGKEGIIVVAATNRPDVLDPALLRPGRFDRQVVVPLPDVKGREAIVKVHMKKVPLTDCVEASLIARGTPGFSGADLANLVNEAALLAARNEQDSVTMPDFERAKDKILMGSERRSMVMSDDEKKLTAYHEAGHAIVGLHMPEHDPVYKVSIIPRGRALGVTVFLPEGDRYSYSLRRLNCQLAALYGGRLAEEIIFGKDAVTTGASNDIERATEIARNMVTKWGLSDKMGAVCYGEDEGEVFLGRSMNRHRDFSEDVSRQIDTEVRQILDRALAVARKTIDENMDQLHTMAEALIKYETIDQAQIDAIMDGKTPPEPAGWSDVSTKAAPSESVDQADDSLPKTDDTVPKAQHADQAST